MAATLGVAVALARTAPPAATVDEDPVKSLIGFAMPPPISVGRLVTMWRPDLFFAVLVVVLGGLYAAGVTRLRRRGDAWPVGRTISWGLGLVTIVAVTHDRRRDVRAGAVQHAHDPAHGPVDAEPDPPRAGRPDDPRAARAEARRDPGRPRAARVADDHPAQPGPDGHRPSRRPRRSCSSPAPTRCTSRRCSATSCAPTSGTSRCSCTSWRSGCLFFWVLIGVDPTPRKLPYLGKMLLLFVTMPFHAFFGIALMNLGTPIAAGWYTAAAPHLGRVDRCPTSTPAARSPGRSARSRRSSC